MLSIGDIKCIGICSNALSFSIFFVGFKFCWLMLVVMFPMPVPNCEFPCRCWLCFASSFSLSSFHLSTGETTLSRCKHEPCRGFVAVCCCSCDCRVCSSELKIKPPCLLVVAAAFPVLAEVMNMLSSVDFGRRSRIQKT